LKESVLAALLVVRLGQDQLHGADNLPQTVCGHPQHKVKVPDPVEHAAPEGQRTLAR